MKKLSLPAIFSDFMVLQQNKNTAVFGTSEENSFIQVSLFNSRGELISANCTKANGSSWDLLLPGQQAQEECTLKISCSSTEASSPEELTFNHIAIGEVWLAGGQSNMEFELQNCTEGPEEIKSERAGKNIRYYYTNKLAWKDDNFYKAEEKTCWQSWESSSKGAWSAVAYFFARQLSEKLDCTIGIIGCNWGGSSASAWMRKEYLEKDKDLLTYLTEQEEAVKGKSIEEQIKEYNDYEIENSKWQEKYSVLWKENHNISWEEAEKTIGKNPWPGPRSCKNPFRPTGLYDCMLSRLIPYTLKGVIWYQGESDDHKPDMYFKLFTSLIQNWRDDWNDSTLPFLFVQLPVHRYIADKDFKHWCLIREAQAKTAAQIKNTFLTCAFDLGQYNDIHPKAKKEVGERLAKNALANIYNKLKKEEGAAPVLRDYYVTYNQDKKGKMLLFFENARDGFVFKADDKRLEEYRQMEERQGTPLPSDFTGFELAGEDKVFYPAEFELNSTDKEKNQITLFSKKVEKPVYARYGWYNYGPVTIYSKNGMPLCPFRTNRFYFSQN